MKLYARLMCAAILATVWQTPAFADPFREIQRAESARTFVPQLEADLDDATPAIAVRAALAIGRTKDLAGAPTLREHLASSAAPIPVRAMCAYALGLFGDVESLDALRAFARHARHSVVRYAAIDAVGRIALAHPYEATRSVANDTIIVARIDPDPVVRAHAAAQLDVFKDPAIARALARSLGQALEREPDQAVRWHLAWAIFRDYARFVAPNVLRRALHDRNELVRVEAARAWGRRTDPRAGAIVRTALDDPSWRVQFEAREALRRIAKLPPTDHLLVDPPGIHLPPLAPTPPPELGVAPTPVLPPHAATSSAPPFSAGTKRQAAADAADDALGPPDPQRIALPPPVVARTARELDAPGPGPHPRVRILTTKGAVVVRLYPEWAPVTVANFLNLARHHYFDGNRWFRIVPDFVVQTGDPNDNGEGDAGYAIGAEENPIEERSGIVAMGLNYDTNGALRDSAGTQFYVTLSPQLHLDRDFSVFGEIQSGFDVLAHLVERDRMIVVTRISDG